MIRSITLMSADISNSAAQDAARPDPGRHFLYTSLCVGARECVRVFHPQLHPGGFVPRIAASLAVVYLYVRVFP